MTEEIKTDQFEIFEPKKENPKEEQKETFRFAMVDEIQSVVVNVAVGESLELMPEIKGYIWVLLDDLQPVNPQDIYNEETGDIDKKQEIVVLPPKKGVIFKALSFFKKLN